MVLKKVGNVIGEHTQQGPRMTDSSWGDPEGLNLCVGYSDLAKREQEIPRDRVTGGTSGALIKDDDLGLSTSTMSWGRGVAGSTSGCPALLQRLGL